MLSLQGTTDVEPANSACISAKLLFFVSGTQIHTKTMATMQNKEYIMKTPLNPISFVISFDKNVTTNTNDQLVAVAMLVP